MAIAASRGLIVLFMRVASASQFPSERSSPVLVILCGIALKAGNPVTAIGISQGNALERRSGPDEVVTSP